MSTVLSTFKLDHQLFQLFEWSGWGVSWLQDVCSSWIFDFWSFQYYRHWLVKSIRPWVLFWVLVSLIINFFNFLSGVAEGLPWLCRETLGSKMCSRWFFAFLSFQYYRHWLVHFIGQGVLFWVLWKLIHQVCEWSGWGVSWLQDVCSSWIMRFFEFSVL